MVAGWLFLAIHDGEGAGPFATRERLHQPRGPQAERALAELAGKAADLQHKLLMAHMTFILAEIREPLKVTPEETALLAAAAEEVVSEAVKAWKPCVAAGLRPILVKYGDDKEQAARIATWTAGQLVPDYLVEKWTPPEWLPQWDTAVEKHLGAARASRWKAFREKRRNTALAAIAPFLQRWGEKGRKRLDEPLEKNLRLLAETSGLDTATRDSLSAQLRQLVDDHVAAEKEHGRDMLLSMPDKERKAFLAEKTMSSRFIVPTSQELEVEWGRIATQVAGEAAFQAWETASKKEQALLAERRLAALKPSQERARTKLEDDMAQEVEALAAALELTTEQRRKLENLGKKAVTESIGAASKGWLKSVESWTEEYLLSRKNVYFSVSTTDLPARRAVWLDGLKEMFSAEDLKRMEQGNAERKARASLALARAALMEADQLLSLTTEQREALEPLVAPQMKNFIREESARTWRVDALQLQMAVRNSLTKEVRGILDDVQVLKWQKLGLSTPQERQAAVPGALAVPKGRPVADTAEMALEVETEISGHMHKRSLRQRAENLQLMEAQVEDASRTLKLAPERKERLSLAAKGAVEADMSYWRRDMEVWTRGQINMDATPEAVRVLLANLETANFSFPLNRDGPSKQPVWEETVADVLSDAEQAAWARVVNERKTYRLRALAGMAVFELDRRRRLAPQQCARLEKILAAVIEDYLPEIESSMSMSRSWSWYLSYYSCLMPLAGAGQADLKAVLTPAQWKLVKDQDMPDAERYWNSIENRRKLRDRALGGNAIMPAPLFFLNP